MKLIIHSQTSTVAPLEFTKDVITHPCWDWSWSMLVKRAPCNHSVYPKKYACGFCFVVLCCGYTLTDFPISIRLTSLALWQSNDCPSASKATLMNMDKYFMWIHYERLHNHNKAKHNKTVCIFLGIYCTMGLLPDTQNCGCACAENAGNVFPITAGKRSRHASRHVRHTRAMMHAGIAN